VQNVWLAPVPGLFLGIVWLIGRPGSVLFPLLEEGRSAAAQRSVVVIDPATDPHEAERIRTRLAEMARTARLWLRRSRVAHLLLGASPAVLFAVWSWASRSGDVTRDPWADVAVPATLIYVAIVLVLVIPFDRRAQRAVQQFQQFEAPEALGSTRLGADKLIMRLIARVEKSSAGEQRLLTEHLWRIVVADQVRRDYLQSGEEFEEAEFAVLLGQFEAAQRDLRVWAGTLPPA
jgi:hypothetical protein